MPTLPHALTICILGTGCRKCNKALRHAHEAVRRLGIEAHVYMEKNINEISRWVMITPGVLIEGRIVAEGYVPTIEMFEAWIAELSTHQPTPAGRANSGKQE